MVLKLKSEKKRNATAAPTDATIPRYLRSSARTPRTLTASWRRRLVFSKSFGQPRVHAQRVQLVDFGAVLGGQVRKRIDIAFRVVVILAGFRIHTFDGADHLRCEDHVVGADNVIFASEMIGAVKGVDPKSGQYYDDTKRYVDALPDLSAEDRAKIYELNALRVYPRLAKALRKYETAAPTGR